MIEEQTDSYLHWRYNNNRGRPFLLILSTKHKSKHNSDAVKFLNMFIYEQFLRILCLKGMFYSYYLQVFPHFKHIL